MAPRTDTKDRLIAATLRTLQTRGISGTSARTIATEAGVNQALVFYHFGSVAELLREAGMADARAAVSTLRDRFAAVGSLADLAELGQQVHRQEGEAGNVAVLAQFLAAGQTDPQIAEVTRTILTVWTEEITTVLRRVLTGSPMAELVDVDTLARLVSSAFIGLELMDGLTGEQVGDRLDGLADLALLAEVIESLGPIERRAMSLRLNRARKRRKG